MAMANPRTGGSARAGGSSSASASSSSGLKRHGGMANLKPNSQSSENFDSSVAESHLFNLLDVTCDKIKELEDLLEKESHLTGLYEDNPMHAIIERQKKLIFGIEEMQRKRILKRSQVVKQPRDPFKELSLHSTSAHPTSSSTQRDYLKELKSEATLCPPAYPSPPGASMFVSPSSSRGSFGANQSSSSNVPLDVSLGSLSLSNRAETSWEDGSGSWRGRSSWNQQSQRSVHSMGRVELRPDQTYTGQRSRSSAFNLGLPTVTEAPVSRLPTVAAQLRRSSRPNLAQPIETPPMPKVTKLAESSDQVDSPVKYSNNSVASVNLGESDNWLFHSTNDDFEGDITPRGMEGAGSFSSSGTLFSGDAANSSSSNISQLPPLSQSLGPETAEWEVNGARLETSKPFETTDVLKYSRKFNDPNLQSMIKNRLDACTSTGRLGPNGERVLQRRRSRLIELVHSTTSTMQQPSQAGQNPPLPPRARAPVRAENEMHSSPALNSEAWMDNPTIV
ncbi:uncharacterized protein LOC110856716 isoform X2 [Folsomia candida]|uniref:uncharacterized protein LOC110856716 isoform X2 n=1 Tax=Folsomia candida TaxID=158441 RepID=UPI000B8F7DD9|nr:uncharacterized protein LOC110856716 isoform X2 [Folsomia candida]